MNKKLIAGDIAAIALLTVVGFFSHGEIGWSYVPRMGTTFFPVLAGWLLIAPWLGLFDDAVIRNKKLLWRIPLTMLFAAPLATLLRAAILGAEGSPLFALVIGVSDALGMMVWRGVYLYFASKN